MSSNNQTLERYYTISGRIPSPYAEQLNNYDISNPYSERLLEYCIWEDYHQKDAYSNCIVKDSDFYLSVKNHYSLDDLKKAIIKFTKDDQDQYPWHIGKMNEFYTNMKAGNLSIEEKKGCALVLSYYTGYKGNSDRINRNVSVITRGLNDYATINKWSDGDQFFPVIYFMSMALSNLPFYWGYTIRCIEMDNGILADYTPGTVVSWLKFSSSTMGLEPAPSFKMRNTWFIIYSFNSREISQFSIYNSEKEALYPPFSHFLIFKKEKYGEITKVYMRQIEIGLYLKNVLWVDDNILNSNWENKGLMEKAYSIKKDLKIIPKISTDCALAFLKSFKPFINDKTVNYKVMSDMNRNNENNSHNAGARLVKYMQDNGFYNIEVMIFTSSVNKALIELLNLDVNIDQNIKVTSSSSEALNFLTSE